MANLNGTKLETADTAKGIPTVTRHSLTLQRDHLYDFTTFSTISTSLKRATSHHENS
jgi:hypothetical protein